MIETFEANLKGRDYVCGDVHGAYSRIEQFLEFVGFNFLTDRLFGVGDLVDRGPENEKSLMLLYKPWFKSVKGNHEIMMIDSFSAGSFWLPSWIRNGGAWAREHFAGLSDESYHIRELVKDVVPNLPEMITVKKKDGTKFHIIHAELWAHTAISDIDLLNPYHFSQVAYNSNSDGQCIFWGRKIFGRMYSTQIDEREKRKIETWAKHHLPEQKIFNDKLSHIYSGHSILRQPVQFYGQTNLDTMAYGSYSHINKFTNKAEEPSGWEGLTFTEPETGKFWLVNSQGVNEITPLIIKENENDTSI